MAKKVFADEVGSAYPEPVRRLIAGFCGMPGIGPRTAERMAQHVLKMCREDAVSLSRALADVKDKVRSCPVCYNLTESDRCSICSDPRRDASVLCVVEQVRDLAAIESSGVFRGMYHVLTGTLSPLDGVGPEHLTLDALRLRVKSGRFAEVILATNPTLEGDGTALAAANALDGLNVKLTRIAVGVPSGSFLEHSSRCTLAEALDGRRVVGGR